MTNTLTTSTDGLVRTADDVAAIAVAVPLFRSDTTPNRWRGRNVDVQVWPGVPFQVAVYAHDAHGHHTWTGIFDHGTPAHVIAHVINDAR